jgi:hypothetical protein
MIKKFNNFLNESRFLNIKEILSYIEDMCLDLKDEGFIISFGITNAIYNPTFPNFWSNLDDIQIKMISLGKEVGYVKIDFIKLFSRLKESQKILIIDSIKSISKYLESENIIVHNYCYQLISGKIIGYNNINDLFSKFNDLKNPNLLRDEIIDIRISFTGQPLCKD